MKVLLIGGGGREDALAWAIYRSPRLTALHCAPGNAGIARHAEQVELDSNDNDALVARARQESYDLVIIGPEAPLVAGLGDRLREHGIAVFGPSAAAARLEGSKGFAKKFMARHRLPTADFRFFSDFQPARRHLADAQTVYPLVVKADGLAAGKGVVIAEDAESGVAAAKAMLVDGRFGDAGSRIVVEEMLRGREASFFVLSDGTDFVELATCQDYKRARDGDQGPNTGGMGTYSPSAYLDNDTRRTIIETIIRPTIAGLAAEEHPYSGVLYAGLMLTEDGPKLLEFNARFGDPETQVLMPRLEGDWLELLHACATGALAGRELRWKDEAAVCVVMTSDGYPGPYPKGLPIQGLEAAESIDGVVVFHAGTSRDAQDGLVTSGGRVLGVTALGADLERARSRAYEAVSHIRWEGEYHRTDIAADALRRSNTHEGATDE